MGWALVFVPRWLRVTCNVLACVAVFAVGVWLALRPEVIGFANLEWVR